MQPVLEAALSNALIATFLGVIVFVVARIWRRPALVHCLWLVVLVRLVMPPLVSVPVNLPAAEIPADVRVGLPLGKFQNQQEINSAVNKESSMEPQNTEISKENSVEASGHTVVDAAFQSNSNIPVHKRKRSSHETQVPKKDASAAGVSQLVYHVSLINCLLAVWVLGTCILLLRAVSRIFRFQRLLKYATPADTETQAIIDKLATGMGIQQAPQTLILPGAVSPMVWAFGRRTHLLLPGELIEELSCDALETVIVHELAHYRRCDHWVRGLELIVTCLFWWHPIVWLAVRELRQVEEECCDAWVVSQLPEQRGLYARTLVQAIGFLSSRPATLSATAGVLGKGLYRSVEERVRAIMSQSPKSGVSLSPVMRFSLVLFALMVLPLVPVTGEDSEKKPDQTTASNEQAEKTTTAKTEKTTTRVLPPSDEPTSFSGSVAALGNVSELAVSSDGRLLAAGHGRAAGPGAFSLWDLKTQQPIGSTVERRMVNDVAFSPDSKFVAYGTWGNLVRVRSTDTLEVVQDISGFAYSSVYVAFSKDGKILSIGQKDIKFYDTTNWTQLQLKLEVDELFSKDTFFLHALDFSPDGSKFLSAGGNRERGNVFGRTVVWDAQTGKLQYGTPHPNQVYAAAFSPDGKQFFAANNFIQICDAETGKEQRKFPFERTPCYDAEWSPDGERIVAGGVVRGIGIFNARTSAHEQLFGKATVPKVHLNTVSYTPDGSKIISGSSDKIIRIWDAQSFKQIAQIPSSEATDSERAPILSVAASPDGRHIAVGREDATITLHDSKDGTNIKSLEGHGDVVSAVAYSSNGLLASASYDEKIKLWDVQTGDELRTLSGHENWVFGIAFSPDGKKLASAGYDKTIRLWNVETGEQNAEMKGHTAAVRSVAFSPDGKRLASASSDRTLKIWNLADKSEVAELKGHSGTVRAVAFSPNGKFLASSAEDSSARLWSTSNWKELHKLEGHQGMVWSVAFSAGGKNLVTGGFDNTVKVWNPETGEIRQTLQGHRDVVSSVTFAPDTSAIVSGSMDRSLKIWRASKR